jgi:hypothetical protein
MTFNTPEIMPFTCPGYLYLTGGLHWKILIELSQDSNLIMSLHD